MNHLKPIVTTLRVLYPVWAVVGMLGLLYIPSQLINADDIQATARNLADQETLWRVGIVASLITQVLYIIVVLYLYRLFEQTHRLQATMMVVLSLVSVPISMLNTLFRIAALYQVDNPEQMMFFLDLNSQGIVIASIFWGLWLFPQGFLINKSGYFPKLIGYAVMIGGVGYTLSSFCQLLFPQMESLIGVFEMMTIGEIIWLLWITIMGAKLSSTETEGS